MREARAADVCLFSSAMLHIADRLKRRAILSSTGWLPKPLRLASRRTLLARLERGRGHRADVIIIAHPKSGTTWLRAMISRLYAMRYDLPASIIVKSDELANLNRSVPRFLITNGHYSYESVIGDALDAGGSLSSLRRTPVILLVRHPCDVAVSWYFQFTKRMTTAKRDLINDTLTCPIDHERIPMWEFVMQTEIGLGPIINFLNSWERHLSQLERSLILRYEDLRADPAQGLRDIVEFIGERCTDDALDDAVAFGSFDNMRKLETTGFFRRGGMSRRNPHDAGTLKVRRGKVLGYRDYFTAEQVEQMDAVVAERLSRTLGYGDIGAEEPPAPPGRNA